MPAVSIVNCKTYDPDVVRQAVGSSNCLTFLSHDVNTSVLRYGRPY